MTHEPAPERPRWSWYVVLLGVGLLINAAGWLLGAVPLALKHPYGIDFGEGLILNQARRMLAGEWLYGPIDRFPYIVANYPPLFYALNAGLQRLAPQVDPLLLGRLLAVLGNLGIIGALFAFVRRFAKTGPVWVWLVPLVWLLAAPAWRWGLVVRVDTVAIALSLWGLYLGWSGARLAAAPLFVAALFTKHSMLSAAMAGLIDYRVEPVRSADDYWRGGKWFLPMVFASAFLIGPISPFAAHLVDYTANEFRAPRLLAGLSEYVALALPLWALLLLVCNRRERNPIMTAALVYVGLSTTTLITFGATGSDSNYYLEPLAALLVAIIIAAGQPRAEEQTQPSTALPWSRDLLAACLIWAFALTNRWGVAGEFPLLADPVQAKRGGDAIVARLQATEGPALSEDFTYLLRAGKTPDFQPYIFRLLAESGKWDQTPFVAELSRQRYDMLLLRTDLFAAGNAEEAGADRMGAGFDRLSPAMEEAIRANYVLDPSGPILADGIWFLYRKRGQDAGGG